MAAIDSPARPVPARVQVARVFALARLLTIVSAVIGGLTYVPLEVVERVRNADIWLDQRLIDWKLYAVIFIFWVAVFAAARRYLRLDTRP